MANNDQEFILESPVATEIDNAEWERGTKTFEGILKSLPNHVNHVRVLAVDQSVCGI